MYNDEERTSISLRNIIIQILIILLFVFLLMWLFPTKSSMRESIRPFSNHLFNENMMVMKDAAKDYFTLERLPQKVGDKITLTLGEMLDLKLLLPFVDSNNNKCDENRSYVEVTKMDNEYVMKVFLSCSDNEDYILVHMGCYDYCSTTICENKEEVVVNDHTRPNVVVPDPTPEPDNPQPQPQPDKKYRCEYLKVINGYYTDWGPWSDWSIEEVFQNDLTKVETQVKSESSEVQKLIGHNVVTYKDPDKPIYKEYQVQTGTEKQTICAEEGKEYVYTGEYKYSEWTYSGEQKIYGSATDSDTKQYKWKSRGVDYSCDGCGDGIYNIYDVFSRSKYEVVIENKVCKRQETKEVPLYTVKKVIVDYETTTRRDPVYKTVTLNIDTTYYRYQKRDLVAGKEDRIWSNCDDQNLLNNGYHIVQKVEEK